MEAAEEEEAKATGLVLDKILPPRLEDAGLEDCALPPDSIKEAFFKAASAVKSRAESLFSTEEEEEKEKGGDFVSPADVRVEGDEMGRGEVVGLCLGEKGGGVVVVGGGEKEGEVGKKRE